MIEAEMYGIIPSANIDALLNAPPKNVLRYPKIPLVFLLGSSKFGSMPGNTIKDPSLKITRNPIVLRILTLRSSIEKMFFMV
jgi:hypothetical protein